MSRQPAPLHRRIGARSGRSGSAKERWQAAIIICPHNRLIASQNPPNGQPLIMQLRGLRMRRHH